MTQKNFRVTKDMYASKGNRFANYIIDWIVFYFLLVALLYVSIIIIVNVSTDIEWLEQFLYDLENINPWMDRLISMVIFMIMYMLSELILKGKTLGKYITKTRVVMEDGSRPKPADIILRSLCRLIPFNAFSFLGDEGRGWHDSMSDTYVVSEEVMNRKIQTINDLESLGKPEEDN